MRSRLWIISRCACSDCPSRTPCAQGRITLGACNRCSHFRFDDGSDHRYEQLQRRVGVHMAQALVGPGGVAVWSSFTVVWLHHRQQRDHVLVSTFWPNRPAAVLVMVVILEVMVRLRSNVRREPWPLSCWLWITSESEPCTPSFWRRSSLGLNQQNSCCRIRPEGFEPLVNTGVEPSKDWSDHWYANGGLSLAREAWPVPVDDSWVAFLALPLLSRVEQAVRSARPTLLGVSALPGCGKTTLCSWAKVASHQLGWHVEHLSLDDFYWPAEALERSMAGNPWHVPGLSQGPQHLAMDNALREWRRTGVISAPRSDKPCVRTRYQRFHDCRGRCCAVEGWFLGVASTSIKANQKSKGFQRLNGHGDRGDPCLHRYTDIWAQLDDLWHLERPRSASSRWKEQH